MVVTGSFWPSLVFWSNFAEMNNLTFHNRSVTYDNVTAMELDEARGKPTGNADVPEQIRTFVDNNMLQVRVAIYRKQIILLALILF